MGKCTAKKIMKLALSYLGTKENPMNSNNVIFNTHYYGKPVNGASYPWCCSYVWDIFRMANASSLFCNGDKTAYCPYVYNWAKKDKLIVDKSKGKYGDIVLFDWDGDGVADHIGFIEKKTSANTYGTVEGNTGIGNDSNGGEVMRRTRHINTILAIVRPKYSPISVKPTVPKPVIKKGDEGSKVKKLQKCLNYVLNRQIEVDGDYGNETELSMQKFKAKAKLTSTNGKVYKEKAYKALKKAVKKGVKL